MDLTPNNFLSQIHNVVTGGGAGVYSTGLRADGGYLHDYQIQPTAIAMAVLSSTTVFVAATSTDNPSTAFVRVNYSGTFATDGSYTMGANASSTIGSTTFQVPRDYDEESDVSILRVLCGKAGAGTLIPALTFIGDQLPIGNNTKTAITGSTSALLSSTASTQIVEFNFSGQALNRDDLVTIGLGTNSANSTAGQEFKIYGLEIVYASDLVSFGSSTDSIGNSLR